MNHPPRRLPAQRLSPQPTRSRALGNEARIALCGDAKIHDAPAPILIGAVDCARLPTVMTISLPNAPHERRAELPPPTEAALSRTSTLQGSDRSYCRPSLDAVVRPVLGKAPNCTSSARRVTFARALPISSLPRAPRRLSDFDPTPSRRHSETSRFMLPHQRSRSDSAVRSWRGSRAPAPCAGSRCVRRLTRATFLGLAVT